MNNQFRELHSAEVTAEVAPHLEGVLLGEERMYERATTDPSGRERWTRVRLTPRRDAGGVVRGYYVVSTDINDMKMAQALVEAKERQLRQVIDSVPTPMVYVDAADALPLREQRVPRIHRPPASAGRRASPCVEVLGEERFQRIAPYLERVRQGESLSVERLVRFADGRSRWMTVRTRRGIVDGQYLGYHSTTSDIHEQKAVEEELRRANSVLSAHFDNTPLAVIEWDTDLRISRWSGQAEGIFGWHASDALGRPLSGWRLVYEDDERAVAEACAGS
jgi:PAS domain-containing protein